MSLEVLPLHIRAHHLRVINHVNIYSDWIGANREKVRIGGIG